MLEVGVSSLESRDRAWDSRLEIWPCFRGLDRSFSDLVGARRSLRSSAFLSIYGYRWTVSKIDWFWYPRNLPKCIKIHQKIDVDFHLDLNTDFDLILAWYLFEQWGLDPLEIIKNHLFSCTKCTSTVSHVDCFFFFLASILVPKHLQKSLKNRLKRG